MVFSGKGIGINEQDDTGRTPLHYAVCSGDCNKISQLLKEGADISYVNATHGSALHAAVRLGNFDVVKLLFDNGIDVVIDAVTDSEYITPLYRNSTALFDAVTAYNTYSYYNVDGKRDKCLQVIRLLLERGANPNIQQKCKMTAVQWAAQAGAAEVVEVFLKFNANVNTKNNKGVTPLMSAVISGVMETVCMLIEAGSDINAVAKGGGTALTYAVYYGHLDIAKYLIGNGADKNAVNNPINKKNETALDVAKKKKFNAIVDIFESIFLR